MRIAAPNLIKRLTYLIFMVAFASALLTALLAASPIVGATPIGPDQFVPIGPPEPADIFAPNQTVPPHGHPSQPYTTYRVSPLHPHRANVFKPTPYTVLSPSPQPQQRIPVGSPSSSSLYMPAPHTVPTPQTLEFTDPLTTMTVSSPFGWRSNRLHTGVDLTMPEGEPIRAAESGLVTFSNVEGAYGNVVAIDHGAGYTTRYAHAQTLLVNEGQWVIKGQPIATVGSTGNATGAHLHFELLHDRDHQDPIPLLNQPFTVAKSPLAPH